jgi:Zn-dependent M28 family amino/carboxypeptidase
MSRAPLLPLAVFAGALCATASAQDLALPAGAEAAALRVTVPSLAAPMRFLASDLLEGRAPGSRGDELARAYLAAGLEAQGFAPGSTDGTYQQRFEMVGIKTRAPARWSFAAAGGPVDLAWWDDYIAETGLQEPRAGIRDAELVFVGYGIQAPEYGWDDFKGAELAGKVLVMLNSDPDWDEGLFAGRTRLYYGRWTYKYESAARHGAAGAILVHTTPSAGYPWKVVQTSWSGEKFELPDAGEPRVPVRAWATEAATRRLLAAAGLDLDRLVDQARSRDFRPVPLGIRTSLELEATLHRVETANVLGLLAGSDPQLSREVVVFSAHHDHLGVGERDARGDGIYNGAVDNATGCAQLLGMASAFAALPGRPRRSILIAFLAAEEQGLLGSRYYAEHPTFPPGRIAAMVNLDAGNVFGRTRDVTYIGYGRSTLDRVVEAAAARQGRTVVGDTLPDRGFFYRSDQFNFARIGVPALYLYGGRDFIGRDAGWGRKLQEQYEATCYHQPCDEFSAEWDLSGLVEDARLAFTCGLAVAEQDELPAWNPGDEFANARARAIEAAGSK